MFFDYDTLLSNAAKNYDKKVNEIMRLKEIENIIIDAKTNNKKEFKIILSPKEINEIDNLQGKIKKMAKYYGYKKSWELHDYVKTTVYLRK